MPGNELNLTYGQLLDAIIKTAETIQPAVADWPDNRPIALSFSNCPEFVVTFMALAWNGIPAMPLFHVHGLLAALLATLYSGGRVILAPRFSASHFVEWTLPASPPGTQPCHQFTRSCLGIPRWKTYPKAIPVYSLLQFVSCTGNPVAVHGTRQDTFVSELPLGPSGKVNRNTLPKALGLA